MYLIIRLNKDNTKDYFGPFPSKRRAEEYANSFATYLPDSHLQSAIVPLIIPNSAQVRYTY